MKKSFWQIVKEVMAEEQIYVKCKDTNCVHNHLGNCNKTSPIIIELDENRKCTSFDFE